MARRQGTKRRRRPTSSADLGRLDALQAVASALAAAMTPSDVAEVVLVRGIALLGARAGSVSLLVDGDGGRLHRLQSRGIPDEILRAYDRAMDESG